MKITNNLNSKNFGSAICLNVHNVEPYNTKNKKYNKSVKVFEDILNSKNNPLYSKKQSVKIQNFFKSVIPDYNGMSGIKIYTKLDGNRVLLCGNELEQVNSQAENQALKRQMIKSNKDYSDTTKNILIKDTFVETDAFVDSLCENGNNKPETSLTLISQTKLPNLKKSKLIKFNEIQYKSYFYQQGYLYDGITSLDIPPTSDNYKQPAQKVAYQISYEEKNIKI